MRLGGLGAAIAATALLTAGFVSPALAAPTDATVRVNEVESSAPDKGPDWVELHNTGSEPVDLSGYQFIDDDDSHTPYVIPEGTVLEPGGFLVLEEFKKKQGTGHFDFGLGKEDAARLLDPSGAQVDSLSWTGGHASGTYGIDPDTGVIVDMEPTQGAPNKPAAKSGTVVLNEIDSAPADAVELYNTGEQPVDLSGFELRDNSDDHRWRFAEGVTLNAGEFLTVDAKTHGLIYSDGAWKGGTFESAIGIGSGDSMRIFDVEGSLVDEFSWTEHASYNGSEADATLSRCPDGTGEWKIGTPTLGAANSCVADITEPEPAPSTPLSPEISVLDPEAKFLEDSSGLDVFDGHLYAIDNGTGTFWKLAIADDGSVSFADGWDAGKRIRFQKDAEDAKAKGPDTEGITLDGEGMVYAASERDNGAKDVNMNTILMVDPNAAGPDLVAQQEWDLTAQLPQVDANTGIEAVEWVPNSALAGNMPNTTTGGIYNPADYPNAIASGLFFVALEANGHVYAFALNEDGSAQLVSEFAPETLNGAMALDFDEVNNELWVVSDNGFAGRMETLQFVDGIVRHTPYPGIATMEDLNNEGFALGIGECTDGMRGAYFFEDGVKQGALKYAGVPCSLQAGEAPEPPTTTPTEPTESETSPTTSATETEDAMDMNNTAAGLASTGAEGLTWMLIVAGAIVVLGVGLFLLGRRNRTEDDADGVDEAATTAAATEADSAADAGDIDVDGTDSKL